MLVIELSALTFGISNQHHFWLLSKLEGGVLRDWGLRDIEYTRWAQKQGSQTVDLTTPGKPKMVKKTGVFSH